MLQKVREENKNSEISPKKDFFCWKQRSQGKLALTKYFSHGPLK